MLQKNRSKYDTLKSGFVLGVFLPILGVLAFWQSKYNTISFSEFIEATLTIQISSALLSLATIPNLAAFFILLQVEKIYAARGVILATLLIAILGFILKFTVG